MKVVAAVGWMLLGLVACENSYLLVAPSEMRQGLSWPVNLELQFTPSTTVTATVTVSKDRAGETLAWPGSELTLLFNPSVTSDGGSLEVPDNLKIGTQLYVTIEFAGVKIGRQYETVVVTKVESTIIVQTDKGMYKPGDTVLIRALQLDGALLPVQDELVVRIKDPRGNTLTETSTASQEGVARALLETEMTISDDPFLGQYTIMAESGHSTKTAYFKVEEYVLPRFDVKLTLKNGLQGLIVNVVATYTYGKPVPGKLTILINRRLKIEENEFDGDHEVEVPYDQVLGRDATVGSVTVVATVAEVFTDKTANATGQIEARRDPPVGFSVMALEPFPYVKRSSQNYTFNVELTGPAFKESEANMYTVLYYAYSEYIRTAYAKGSVVFEGNPMSVSVPTYIDRDWKDLDRVEVWAVYKNATSNIPSEKTTVKARQYSSISGDSVNIIRVPSPLQNEACFMVDQYAPKDFFYYMVLSNVGTGPLMQYRDSSGHCFTLTADHAPACMVVVMKVDLDSSTNELLVSSLIINSDWEPRNQVSLEISPKKVEPGKQVEILVQSQTNTVSLVGLSGVDKSTELLAEGNKIKQQQLSDAVTKSRTFTDKIEQPTDRPIPLGAVEKRSIMPHYPTTDSASVLLQRAGLLVLTSVSIQNNYFDWNGPMLEDGMMMPAARPDSGSAADTEGNKKVDNNVESEPEEDPEEARTFFPETWLWDVDFTNEDGVLLKTEKVPDTITSWVVDAFALNPQTGLGLAQTQELKVMKDYFLVMNLPYALVRGEEFTLEILVFNYLSTELQVKVTLDKSDQFLALDDTDLEIIIGGSATGVAEYGIKATMVGDIQLRAAVDVMNMDLPSDIVQRILPVKPEGNEERVSKEIKLNVVDSQGLVDVDLNAFFAGSSYSDENYIQDSLRMILYVTGDLMGPMIGNLENKLQMPYGCGEQNMKTVIPNIVVYKYLKRIKRLEPEISAMAKKFCSVGYNKELIYQHRDGGFSAFGESDGSNSSTWLTAFVLKSFSQMKNEDIIYVSNEVLEGAFKYLLAMFTPDSSTSLFSEIGVLFHKEMKGGTSSQIGFSAFCLIAIMEYQKTNVPHLQQNITNIIEKSTTWLRSKEADLNLAMKPYQFAISAYTLAHAAKKGGANYETAKRYLNKFHMYKNSTVLPDPECPPVWHRGRMACDSRAAICITNDDCSKKEKCCSGPCGQTCTTPVVPSRTSGPSKIEMHSYALLTYTSLYAVETETTIRQEWKQSATDEMVWLLERRKAGGLFESTQDTAIAMEALAQYAITFPETITTDFTLSAVSGGQTITEPLHMNSNNYTHLAERKLAVTSKPENLQYRVGGTSGIAFVTLLAIYNVKEGAKSKVLDIKVDRINDKEVLRQCITVLDYTNLGPMVVASITPPSGVVFKGSKSSSGQKANRIEMNQDDGKFSTYYTDIQENGQMCVDVDFEETIVIQNRQAKTAVVMDYYNLENSAETLYQVQAPATCIADCPTTGAQGVALNLILGMSALVLALILYRE